MFKTLFMVLAPQPASAQALTNQFITYVVAMPDELMPILRKRMFTVLMQMLYDTCPAHDLSMHNLIDLDNLFLREMLDEQHNLILDGLHFSHLLRFCQAERVMVGRSRLQLMEIDNADYWNLLGDLLESMIRPTKLIPLSF